MSKNKKELKLIKEFCDRFMPLVMRNTIEKHIMTGRELKANNYPDAEKYADDQKVIFNYPVQIYMNHYRAIKDAWYDGGYPAISAYFERIIAGIKKTKEGPETEVKIETL